MCEPLDKNILYIFTVLEAIEKIYIYSNKYNNAEEFFEANEQMNFNASLNLLIAIGEDSQKIDNNLKKEFKNIEWKSIKGLRNELSHNYRGVDIDIIWDIIENFLPELKENFIKIFQYLIISKSNNNSKVIKILKTKHYHNIQYLIEIIKTASND